MSTQGYNEESSAKIREVGFEKGGNDRALNLLISKAAVSIRRQDPFRLFRNCQLAICSVCHQPLDFIFDEFEQQYAGASGAWWWCSRIG